MAYDGLFAGLAAFVFVTFMVTMLIVLAVAVMQIIGQWKMFEKAKEEGWKAIIPVYNQVVMCNLVGVSPWWILIVFCLGVLTAIPFLGILIAFVYTIAILYFLVVYSISIARSYGKEDVWALGLIFLSPVFFLLLGISKDVKYVGPKPMEDPVWDWLVVTFGGNNKADVTEAKVEEVKTIKCPKCKKEIPDGVKYCPECGKEVKGKK